MRMNEGFFGQYSVFCVFGSVVGCVVVPLIAQVLQQQSMECVILSAIVISLTAAHLNKKGGHDATASYSKIVMASDLERKKTNHCKKPKAQNLPCKQHQRQQDNEQIQMLTTAEQVQFELEHMDHNDLYKISDVERRLKEKRLKKLRKREERLKKREEELKKEKELEEHYRTMREKRVKQHMEESCYQLRNRNSVKPAARDSHKYCGSTSTSGNWENKRIHGNRLQSTSPNAPGALKLRTLHTNTNLCSQQKIPRFENSRSGTEFDNHASLSQIFTVGGSINGCESVTTFGESPVNNLTIKCNLSASCSSLSSISSLSSGSASPPMSACAYKSNTTTPWSKATPLIKQVESPLSLANNKSYGQWHPSMLAEDVHVMKCDGGKEMENSLKAYSSNPDAVIPQKFIPHSSLFCSQLDGKVDIVREGGGHSQPIAGSEYSLFGPQGFVTSLAR